jgi:hypothetical protein
VSGHVKGDSPFEIDATPEQIKALIEGGHIVVEEPLPASAHKPPFTSSRNNKPALRPEREKRTDA